MRRPLQIAKSSQRLAWIRVFGNFYFRPYWPLTSNFLLLTLNSVRLHNPAYPFLSFRLIRFINISLPRITRRTIYFFVELPTTWLLRSRSIHFYWLFEICLHYSKFPLVMYSIFPIQIFRSSVPISGKLLTCLINYWRSLKGYWFVLIVSWFFFWKYSIPIREN